MRDGRLSNHCTVDDCYFARVGDRSHGPEECVSTAEVEALIARFEDAPCAGCGAALRAHAHMAHRWFERWGEQDETWAAELN